MTAGSVRMPLAAAFATVTAAICLGTVFLSGAWFLPTVIGVLFVAVGCELARRLAATRATVPVGGLAALAAYLLLRYGHEQAIGGVLPWTESVERLGRLAELGRRDINRYAAPVGVSAGIELLTVAGVGLVAVAVDTLAVTWRRAALAGLPLLVLYTVPTALAPQGVGWVAFTLAGIAFLTLLLAESHDRVGRWGRSMDRVVRSGHGPAPETAPLGQVGRRVGATALGLALVVPAVLPDLTLSSFGLGTGGFGRGGDGRKVTVINPILRLGDNLRQGQNTPLIRYRGQPTYLRLVGLDTFTGDTWAPSDLKVSTAKNNVEDGLAPAPGLGAAVPTVKRSYRIQVFDLDQRWLPLPYPTTRVRDIDGTWLYDSATFNVFGQNSSTRQLSYRVRAIEVSPTAAQLAAAPASVPRSLRRYLQLPDDLDPVIAATAGQVTKGETTAYGRAVALQDWLRDPANFTYSQTVDATGAGDGNGGAAITSFLRGRRGYCVQFASTMAVMARQLGIAARVGVGFTAGQRQPDGSYLVRAHNAHAWPELYFQSVGWVRFEPTPGGPASPTKPAYTERPEPGTTPTDQPGPSASAPAGAGNGQTRGGSPNRDRADVLAERPAGGGGIGAGPVRVPVVPFVAGLAVLVLLAVPAATRILLRRRRWRGATSPAEQALAAWADLQDSLVDHGYPWDPSDPPRRGAARLTQRRRLAGAAAEALARLAAAAEQARYAPRMSAVGELRRDVDTVRVALSAGASRPERWRARLLPRSTRGTVATVASRLADGLDAIDAVLARVSARLRLRRA